VEDFAGFIDDAGLDFFFMEVETGEAMCHNFVASLSPSGDMEGVWRLRRAVACGGLSRRIKRFAAWRIERPSERELGRTATIYSSSKLNRVVRKGGQI
jgi:hypothetical protein